MARCWGAGSGRVANHRKVLVIGNGAEQVFVDPSWILKLVSALVEQKHKQTLEQKLNAHEAELAIKAVELDELVESHAAEKATWQEKAQ